MRLLPVAAFAALTVVNAALWVTVLVQSAPSPESSSIGQADVGTAAAPSATSSPRPGPDAGATSSPADPGADTDPPRREVRVGLTRYRYTGRPHETVTLSGVLHGAPPAARLRVERRVERRDSARWQPFPVPVTTGVGGRFQAYAELGSPGTYRLRVVEPASGAVSPAVTLLIT